MNNETIQYMRELTFDKLPEIGSNFYKMSESYCTYDAISSIIYLVLGLILFIVGMYTMIKILKKEEFNNIDVFFIIVSSISMLAGTIMFFANIEYIFNFDTNYCIINTILDHLKQP